MYNDQQLFITRGLRLVSFGREGTRGFFFFFFLKKKLGGGREVAKNGMVFS